jgi:hypothetical protein
VPPGSKLSMSTAFGITVTLSAVDAARHDVVAQAFADGEDMVGAAQRVGLQPAGQAVAQAALGGGAVVDGRVLPEGAHLVDHRDAQLRPTRSAGRR